MVVFVPARRPALFVRLGLAAGEAVVEVLLVVEEEGGSQVVAYRGVGP